MQFQQSCFTNFSVVYNAFVSYTSEIIPLKKELLIMSIYWTRILYIHIPTLLSL